MIKYLITLSLLIFSLHSSSQNLQFSFKQLVSYIHMPYDSLDEVLSKKGLNFEETKNVRENSVVSTWHCKSINLGIMSTPDTVTLMNNDVYIGYTDVNKKGLCYGFIGKVQYDLLNYYAKNHLVKYSVQTEGKYIVLMYSSNQYIVTLKKTIENNIFYGLIEIQDLAYEIGEQHYQ